MVGQQEDQCLIIQEVIRHMEAAPARELLGPKTEYQKRIRSLPPGFKRRLPRISYARCRLFPGLRPIPGQRTRGSLPENLGLWPFGRQLADGQKADLFPGNSKGHSS